jgi:hypothetical protein
MKTSDPIDLAMGAKIPVDFKGIHAVKMGRLDVPDLNINDPLIEGEYRRRKNPCDYRWPTSFDSLAIQTDLTR